MSRRWLRFAGLTLLLGFAAVPAAHADTRWSINVGVGGSRVGVAPAPYGYVWEPGRYVWTGYDYRWIEGYWIPPQIYGSRAVAPYGDDRNRDDRRWDDRGRWDRDRDRDENRGRDWRNRGRDRDRDRDWDRDRGDWRR